ncbi:MFS transporter [Streptomyces kaempferi]
MSVRRWPLHGTDTIDPTPSDHWPVPPLLFEPGPADGPVLVSVAYRVGPGNRAAFTDCMENVARSRRRTGALTWGLYEDGNDPDRFIENYLVASWAEHLAQHHSRTTATDRRHEEWARSLLVAGTVPEVTHAFDAAAVLSYQRLRQRPAPPPRPASNPVPRSVTRRIEHPWSQRFTRRRWSRPWAARGSGPPTRRAEDG